MTPYALTGLGAQRFEELSQALALKTLGASVEVFGDGPDGGREATFQGLTHFPNPDTPWTGYGVLQAKFRSRPEGPGKDADWLIGHIKAELDAWGNPASHRVRKGRLPDYLLITTNVVLSAVAGNGGIDRVHEAVRERVRQLNLPLKAWEVWHYDKICRLLDNNEDVRHANADAILPGDVLARLHALLEELDASRTLSHSASYGLPRELRRLIGREEEVGEALAVLQAPNPDDRRPVLITGGPGMGKSSLALRLARLVEDQYPDGQYHLDLALATSEGAEVDLVSMLLQVLRPAGDRLPEGSSQRCALLRALLADRRVLLLVDDIVSEEALLEVLQMDGPFALVCTSRNRLSGLAGLLHCVEVGPLPTEHGEALVKAVAGPARLASTQTSELVHACGGHPLALQIAAAHLARRPKADADRFIKDISNPDHGLRALRAGQSAIEPVIERSFAALGPEQAHLLTVLGVLPHMSITVDVAATARATAKDLADVRLDVVAELLDELFELSLIEQIDEDRYVFHEILHRFARLKSASTTQECRETAIRHACLMTAARAESATESIGFTDEDATVPAPSNLKALQRLNADRPGAVALVELARKHQIWGPLVTLVADYTAALWHGSHWSEIQRVYQCVLEAGTQSDNPEWAVSALHNLALTAAHLGDSQRAADLYHQAAQTAHDANEPHLMHLAELAMGSLLVNLGRARDAIPYLRHGLPYWRLTNSQDVLAQALGNLGQAYLAIGQVRRAERYLRNSRTLLKAGTAADLWNRSSLSALLRAGGRMTEAAQQAVQDIERARAVGSRTWEAMALMALAETPPQDRPTSAPVDPLEAALAIYRDTGDIQGQVRALHRLGRQAAERAEIDTAAEYLSQCADLATDIGDYDHAAQSVAYLASFRARVGDLEDADAFFHQAQDMARLTSNPVSMAQVLQKNAEFVWRTGRIGQAVTLLTEAAGLLEGTEHKQARSQVTAALGEALVISGQWQEGARMLKQVVSDTSDDALPHTKAQASRALAILYSRRGLHAEAKTVITKALDTCERAGDAGGTLDARMALANVYARNHEWPEALTEYQEAEELAKAQKDLHMLLVAKTQAALCLLQGEEPDQAVADLDHLLPLAQQLGLHSLEASVHVNIGVHHAGSGDSTSALERFSQARSLIDDLGDDTLLAPCLMNLARCYKALGEVDTARRHAREAFGIHQRIGGWAEAGEALLELARLHAHGDPDATEPTIDDLLGTQKLQDRRVLESIRTRLQPADLHLPSPKDDDPRQQATALDGRRISIAASVQRELAGQDSTLLLARLANSRQTCDACGLLIDETGDAELLLLQHPEIDHVVVRLAHPHCVASQVLQLNGRPPKAPKEIAEVECIMFGGERAGIIVDCYGGFGSVDGGPVQDLVLDSLITAGFTDLRSLLNELEDGDVLDFRTIPPVHNSDVQARLEDNRLSVSGLVGDLLSSAPLNFFPHWYRAAREGTLIIVVGRNLQGMAADDMSYLLQAIDSGQAVGATVPLTVARPRRNAPCPCMMRTGRKFKHCCGSSGA
ncbi:tetratricopeptide repeat protein [Kitasatospora kifunensis]|uniref:Tetratricopeptide (TPR) repeat protein n=1 Tax=Kitasatospora kifunensis TaxID=58351 RepID=A0A7W7VTB3_KITKI|nr:tetratricopeptide repeat protein [Kitasatospora kifunensis]MBB4921464.1 tetratricopeptide (TPR) repeat protein [Kitasatospora kifunensis]